MRKLHLSRVHMQKRHGLQRLECDARDGEVMYNWKKEIYVDRESEKMGFVARAKWQAILKVAYFNHSFMVQPTSRFIIGYNSIFALHLSQHLHHIIVHKIHLLTVAMCVCVFFKRNGKILIFFSIKLKMQKAHFKAHKNRQNFIEPKLMCFLHSFN